MRQIYDVDKLYVANAGDGKVNVYDGATYTLRKSIEIGEDPDNTRYDPTTKKVFVGFGEENGGNSTIDPATDERVGEVFKTGGHPESFHMEASGSHIFLNVPDADNVTESMRLFVITRKAPMMVVIDTQTGNEIARLRAAGECDDVFFDASRKRIYVIGGEGFISVFQQDDPAHYSLIQNVPSAIGVRTGFWFAKRDRFYVAVPAKGNDPAQIWTYEAED